MGREIERKFLVTGEGWRESVTEARPIRRFYLARTDRATVRVRITDDRSARLTVKSSARGASRDEYEWEIPLAEAKAMEPLRTGRVIEKTRHPIPAGDFDWEIDCFAEGPLLAEIELPDERADFARPPWPGEEVTGDPRFYNAAMALGAGSL